LNQRAKSVSHGFVFAKILTSENGSPWSMTLRKKFDFEYLGKIEVICETVLIR
jgi:hypothetical protein